MNVITAYKHNFAANFFNTYQFHASRPWKLKTSNPIIQFRKANIITVKNMFTTNLCITYQ